MNFESFQLDPRIQKGLGMAGYETATPIQTEAIPAILAGHDLVATAQTGTGKTAAFVLPLLHQLLAKSNSANKQTRALIITPTRELAEQIFSVITQLGKLTPIRCITVYGGVGMMPQEKALRKGVEIIVACPGRLLDHVNRGNARLNQVEYLVLDEADRMLDMGFLPPIQKILQQLPAKRQTLMFSATFDSSLDKLAAQALRDPKRISIGISVPASTVAHALYPVAMHLKTGLLLKKFETMAMKSVLVFTRTKHRADKVMEKIQRAGFKAAALHSNKSQGQRKFALDQFRAGHIQVLVATDIAARGLDIASVSHVVNYDIPNSATDYIHRIGRTGRAARSGEAMTLVTPEDKSTILEIEKLLGRKIERLTVTDFNYQEVAKEYPATTDRYPRNFGKPFADTNRRKRDFAYSRGR